MAGETGDPRGGSPTSGIVRRYSHVRKLENDSSRNRARFAQQGFGKGQRYRESTIATVAGLQYRKSGCRAVPPECVSARTVLWWLVFTGAAMNHVIRMGINIAIIGMVKDQSSKYEGIATGSRCYNATPTEGAANNSTTRTSSLVDTDEDKVDWDEYQQNLVIGSSFWVYWITQIPSGIITRRYGTKLVFGLSNYATCLLGLLIPFATFQSFYLLMAIRVLQGLAGGFVWPAVHTMTGAWIPPNERSKFISSYTGVAFGVALLYSVGGQMVYWLGWRSVFYATGVLGTIWYLAWYLLMFDSPDKHPRISEEERRYIKERIANSHTQEKLPTPWKSILLSVPVWLVFFTHWGTSWCSHLTLSQAPTYLYAIHGWNLQVAGVMSAFPQLLGSGCAIVLSRIFDKVLQKNTMSRTGIRKLAIAMCCLVQGAAMVIMAFSGCNSTVAMAGMLLGVCVQSLETSGQLASLVDISPNFAGILLGIMHAMTSVTGFTGPILVGYLTQGNQTTRAWQKVFLISAAMVVVPDILHLVFGASELQPWNSPDSKVTDKTANKEELQELNSTARHEDDQENM
ncbi:hypothetical protein PR048_025835 [Dryococelus australis]|uniref:Major facilitator superfamily (MFS) profile domain-containing protein n=1 Tax=Dryococelus australis TaxID=614101 RepID=A0ABQ9GJM4_9NEOP|nr:hypothetical protein PR048_025835 [Dryococelus australis]